MFICVRFVCIWRVRARVLLSVEQPIFKHTNNCWVVILTPINTSSEHVFLTVRFNSLGVSAVQAAKKRVAIIDMKQNNFLDGRRSIAEYGHEMCGFRRQKEKNGDTDMTRVGDALLPNAVEKKILSVHAQENSNAKKRFCLLSCSYCSLTNVPNMIDNEIFKRFALYASDYTFWSIKCAGYNQ